MSLSNPRTQTPVRKFFRVRGSTGHVVFYDKGEQQEIEVNTPFKFIVLDILNTIGGFSDKLQSGLWANETRTTKDILRVRTKNGPLLEGAYADISAKVKAEGGKFANSIYIAYQEDGDWALGNLNLIGAALSEFFDFKKGKSLDSDPGVVITAWEPRTKGRTEYFIPVFQRWQVSAGDLGAASSLDVELQEYLSGRKEPEEPVVHNIQNVSYGQQSFGGPLNPEAPF